MFPTFISIGRCIYYIAVLGYENKHTILTAYSLFDTSKFVFYVSEKIGIVETIKKRITQEPPPMLLEISHIEHTELGNFEVIDM